MNYTAVKKKNKKSYNSRRKQRDCFVNIYLYFDIDVTSNFRAMVSISYSVSRV